MNLKDDRIFRAISLIKESFGRYKWQVVILTILGFVGGLLEAVGVNAIIPLFSFATKGASEATDTISRLIQDFFTHFDINYSLKSILILIPLLFIMKTILMIAFHYIKILIIAGYERRVRSELFKKTMSAKWSYLLRQKTGYLEKTLMVDVASSAHLLSYLSELILVLTSLIMYTLVALNISVIVTLLTLILGAFLFLVLKPIVYKVRQIAKREEGIMKEVASFVNENIYGMKTIKSLNVSKPITSKADGYFDDFKKLKIKNLILSDGVSVIIQLISILFVVALFAFFYLTQDFNFASFAAIIYLIQKIFVYIQSGQNKIHSINAIIPYLNNVNKYNRETNEQTVDEKNGVKFSFDKSLKFNNIEFIYADDKIILKDIEFEIKKGEMVGLVGSSGAGKTTLVDILLRLFKPTKGNILLDDKNIDKISLSEWQRNVSYVSQDIFLINDSIKNNIRFYDNLISDERIIKAAKAANIYNFIESLPKKFMTEVGERGVMLSGGQRQRIALARMLARNPKILILDEATSALDNESEIMVQKAIEKLRGEITVIIIAHRLSTVIGVDKLVVLDKGKIIESGSPKKLLEDKNSHFHKIYNIK